MMGAVIFCLFWVGRSIRIAGTITGKRSIAMKLNNGFDISFYRANETVEEKIYCSLYPDQLVSGMEKINSDTIVRDTIYNVSNILNLRLLKEKIDLIADQNITTPVVIYFGGRYAALIRMD
jgi:hypothetical protein